MWPDAVPWDRIGRLLTCAVALIAIGACAAPMGTGSTSPTRHPLGSPPTAVPHGRDYEEDGLASWYGRSYQGKPTASGEPFDASALTAAHLTLPMQSCVEITKSKDRQTVVVRINDRGPFAAGRVIDLSEAAAVAIGMLEEGVVWVHLRVITRADSRGACPDGPASAPARTDPAELGRLMPNAHALDRP